VLHFSKALDPVALAPNLPVRSTPSVSRRSPSAKKRPGEGEAGAPTGNIALPGPSGEVDGE
jgi:hypothetical protein